MNALHAQIRWALQLSTHKAVSNLSFLPVSGCQRAIYHLVFMHPTLIVVIRCSLTLLLAFPLFPLRAQTSLPDHPQPQQSFPDAPSAVRRLPDHSKPQVSAGATQAKPRVDEAWPRKATRGDDTISMHHHNWRFGKTTSCTPMLRSRWKAKPKVQPNTEWSGSQPKRR